MSQQAINRNFFLKRIVGYALLFILVWYCTVNYNSGPCTLNLDLFSWVIAVGICVALAAKNIVQFAVSTDRKRLYSLSIHVLALVLLWLYGKL